MMKYSSLEPRLLDMFRSPMDSQADHLQGKLMSYIHELQGGQGGSTHQIKIRRGNSDIPGLV